MGGLVYTESRLIKNNCRNESVVPLRNIDCSFLGSSHEGIFPSNCIEKPLWIAGKIPTRPLNIMGELDQCYNVIVECTDYPLGIRSSIVVKHQDVSCHKIGSGNVNIVEDIENFRPEPKCEWNFFSYKTIAATYFVTVRNSESSQLYTNKMIVFSRGNKLTTYNNGTSFESLDRNIIWRPNDVDDLKLERITEAAAFGARICGNTIVSDPGNIPLFNLEEACIGKYGGKEVMITKNHYIVENPKDFGGKIQGCHNITRFREGKSLTVELANKELVKKENDFFNELLCTSVKTGKILDNLNATLSILNDMPEVGFKKIYKELNKTHVTVSECLVHPLMEFDLSAKLSGLYEINSEIPAIQKELRVRLFDDFTQYITPEEISEKFHDRFWFYLLGIIITLLLGIFIYHRIRRSRGYSRKTILREQRRDDIPLYMKV